MAANTSRPRRCVLWKSGALNADNAESLAGWGLHYDPTIQATDNVCPQRFKPGNLRRNIVGFNVDMNSAFVFHALDLHDGLVWGCFQHAVVSASPRMTWVYRATQCIRPEPGSLVYIRSAAVNQKRTKAGAMHGEPLIPGNADL